MATDLEGFVSSDGRDDKIAEVRRRIDAEGITYIYYQFISVTGRIMGKGVPAPHWESMAQKGFQLVYGSTANLFTDRHGEYIGYGPEAWELVGVPEPETFQVLPWDPKVARVWCTCFRGREDEKDGGVVPQLGLPREPEADPGRVRAAHRAAPAGRHRAGDDVAEDEAGRHARRGGRDQALLLPHRPVLRAAADHPQGDRVRPGDGAGHDPGRPRGRPRPDRAELQLRPRRGHGRQPQHLPPDLQAGGARAERVPVLHAQAVHGRVGQRLPPQHLAVAGRRERVHAGGQGPAAAQPDRPLLDRRRARAPGGADGGDRADGELLPAAVGHRLLGARVRRLGLPEPHDGAARVGAGSLRVPVGRLGGEPVPVAGGADQGDG